METGERRINDAEAKIVRRIFCEYAAGQSPRSIALGLNRDGIGGPRGRAVRSLIDRVVLRPFDGGLTIDLHGEIAEILKLSAGGKKHGVEAGEVDTIERWLRG